MGQSGEGTQFRRNNPSRVARAFEHALHKKSLIFGITFSRQISFQNSLVGLEDEEA